MEDKGSTHSADDRMLAGAASGLAEHLDIDPAIIRILFIIITFLGGGVTAFQ